MSKEPNNPIPAQELTDKELEGISGGATAKILPKMGEPMKWEEVQLFSGERIHLRGNREAAATVGAGKADSE